jgi:hypothetical protein
VQQEPTRKAGDEVGTNPGRPSADHPNHHHKQDGGGNLYAHDNTFIEHTAGDEVGTNPGRPSADHLNHGHDDPFIQHTYGGQLPYRAPPIHGPPFRDMHPYVDHPYQYHGMPGFNDGVYPFPYRGLAPVLPYSAFREPPRPMDPRPSRQHPTYCDRDRPRDRPSADGRTFHDGHDRAPSH